MVTVTAHRKGCRVVAEVGKGCAGCAGYTVPTVDFDLPDDPNGTVAKGHATMDAGTITEVVVDDPGSGYSKAPGVAVHNGTLMDPIAFGPGGKEATVSATLKLVGLTVDQVGTGYTNSSTVTITDPTGSGSGAAATLVTDNGAITGITVTNGGTGYLTAGMKKFQNELPLPCDPTAAGTGCPNTTVPASADAKFLPLAVPEHHELRRRRLGHYEIGLVQYRTKFSTDLPATLVRGYVQLSAGQRARPAGPADQRADGRHQAAHRQRCRRPYTGVTSPQWLGPIIAAHQGQAGPHRLPQPAADGRGRRPVPARPTAP